MVVAAGLISLVFQTWSTPAVAQVGAIDGTAFSEYSGLLDEAQVVPTRTNSPATGDITVGLDQVTNTVDIHLHLTGINRSNVTAIQLRQGRTGTNGSTIVMTLELARLEEVEPGALEWSGATIPIPANRIDTLRTGNVYVIVATSAFPAGEIRGQLTLAEDEGFDLTGMPGPLQSVPVPTPNLTNYVRDMNKAKILGKALFWDMQLGSDGRTACASCHFHAGVDMRTRNAVGLPPRPLDQNLRIPNGNLKRSDFPFHKLSDVRDRDSAVLFDTAEVCGSAGVLKKRFTAVTTGSAVDQGVNVLSPDFSINGSNIRQVEPRNTPTVINAVFNDRQFWDGRANRFFLTLTNSMCGFSGSQEGAGHE